MDNISFYLIYKDNPCYENSLEYKQIELQFILSNKFVVIKLSRYELENIISFLKAHYCNDLPKEESILYLYNCYEQNIVIKINSFVYDSYVLHDMNYSRKYKLGDYTEKEYRNFIMGQEELNEFILKIEKVLDELEELYKNDE